jgi:hypothetical protein
MVTHALSARTFLRTRIQLVVSNRNEAMKMHKIPEATRKEAVYLVANGNSFSRAGGHS